jgi:hypothetical protein
MRRSYGICIAAVEGPLRRFARVLTVALLVVAVMLPASAGAQVTKPIKVVVLGDSLTAGLGGIPGAAAKSLASQGDRD